MNIKTQNVNSLKTILKQKVKLKIDTLLNNYILMENKISHLEYIFQTTEKKNVVKKGKL